MFSNHYSVKQAWENCEQYQRWYWGEAGVTSTHWDITYQHTLARVATMLPHFPIWQVA